ncbi:hypothetical protein HDU98_009121 [Podochytrium sp. JEL0797]|nr:hypothetical protein HDU98_009121 [Podochytrium sp. JEL0797]
MDAAPPTWLNSRDAARVMFQNDIASKYYSGNVAVNASAVPAAQKYPRAQFKVTRAARPTNAARLQRRYHPKNSRMVYRHPRPLPVVAETYVANATNFEAFENKNNNATPAHD